jgi:gliding-associated putative ABC transporter substrate-binding component GldG
VKNTKNIIILILTIILVNILVNTFDYKIDMTADKRYTLSKTTEKVVQEVKEPLQIIVFLKGDFPSGFKRLARETKSLLQDLKDLNPKIDFVFINPLEQGDDYIKSLINKGLQPAQISITKSGKLEQLMIFPWAIIQQNEHEIPVSLIADVYSQNPDEQIEKSIENLEYAFANAINLMNAKKEQKIAILKGNGELDDLHIADFLMSLGKKYRLAPYTLDSVAVNPQKTLQDLNFYDLAIIAKPTEKFTEEEKFVLDQYLMKGGRMLWLIDAVKAHKDTLMYHGKTYALNAELNLTDMFFAYGVRIKPQLVKDLIAAPVVLKVGQVGNRPQLEQFPWFYSPLAQPDSKHPIGKNLEMVKLDFAAPMDTLKNNTPKTVLLKSSPKTQLTGVPAEINFDEIGKKPDINNFTAGTQIFGVLLEGNIKSAYNHRVKPFKTNQTKEYGNTALIIISDGDIIKNDTDKGKPLELGFDKWSKMKYDNKQFLLNAVDYLMDKSGVISLKNKEIKLRFLDENKLITDLRFWQIINTLLPLFLIGIAGFLYQYYRKKKYTR